MRPHVKLLIRADTSRIASRPPKGRLETHAERIHGGTQGFVDVTVAQWPAGTWRFIIVRKRSTESVTLSPGELSRTLKLMKLALAGSDMLIVVHLNVVLRFTPCLEVLEEVAVSSLQNI